MRHFLRSGHVVFHYVLEPELRAMIDLRMVIPIFGILLVMIPVTGLTVALVAKTLAKIRRDADPPFEVDGLTARVALLQEEVESLTLEVRELKAAQDFDRKLLGKEAAR